MSMGRIGLLTAALCTLLLAPVSVQAQERGTVTGTVIDRSTNEPLSGVQLSIPRTALGTITNAEGRFVLVNVPAGPIEVRANSIGYASASETVTVTAGETVTVSFSLAPSAVALDEIVVTGTMGAVERRKQPAVVGSINAAEQVERGTSNSVTDLLTARVPGVQVTASSGVTGTAQQIRIRGASSITLSNEPLVFIDGIKVSSRTLNDINIGGQGVSQLFDLNPADIERIEVVKGPAAAALYGADASAGVIQIFTKQGRPGADRYAQTISLEYNQLDQNWTPPSNFAACTEAQVAPTSTSELCRGQAIGTVVSDNPLDRNGVFEKGHLRSVGYSGRGGGENYGYYLSVGYDKEEATLPNNEMDRRSGRVNFTFVPRTDLRFEAGLGLSRTESLFPINDNNIFGFLGGGLLGRPTTVRMEDGQLVGGYYIPQRNQEAITSIESQIRTLRYTPTIQASYTPRPWFTNQLTVGADVSRTEGTQYFPRNNNVWYGGDADTGSLEEERINFDVYTASYLATFSRDLSDNVSGDLSLGVGAVAEVLDNVVGTGINFVTNANRVIGAAAQISAGQDYQKTTSIGYLGQANLAFWDRLYLQMGARIDQFSSFGEQADPFFLPQVGVSYVISDESFWEPLASAIPTLRLRAAYGTTGRAPSAGASLETYDATPFSIVEGATGNGVTPSRPGNYDLKPEKGTEFEAGFEAGFLSGRLGLDVTFFNKTTTDLILQVPVPPSAGFSAFPFRNIGEVVNRGFEVALRGSPVQLENFRWDFNVAASTLHNELIDLGGVEAFGTMNRFEEGVPLGSFHSQKILDIDVANNRVTVSNADDLRFLGNYLPDFEGAFSTTFTLFENVALTGLLDWKQNFKIYNNTAQFRDRAFVNSETGIRRNDILSDVERMRRYGPFFDEDGTPVSYTQVNEAYIQDGDFVRLRELTATFTLPDEWAQAMRAAGASFTFGGRNLKLWSDYGGHDPEVLAQATRNTGAATFQREDFLTVPQPRRWIAKLNLTF